MPAELDGTSCPCCIWRKQFNPNYVDEPCNCHFIDMARQLDEAKHKHAMQQDALQSLPIMHIADETTCDPLVHARNCLPLLPQTQDYDGEDMILRVNVRSGNNGIDSDFEIEAASENEMLQTIGLLNKIQSQILQAIYTKHGFGLKFEGLKYD